MNKPSPTRVSPLTVDEHKAFIADAVENMTATPQDVARHYLHIVFKQNGCSVSRAARTMGLHRRTVQRMLDKKVEP